MSNRSSLAVWLLSGAALGGLVLHLHAHDAAQLDALSRALAATRAGGDRGGGAPAVGVAQGIVAPAIDAATIDAIAARVASRLHSDGAAPAAASAPATPAPAWTPDQHVALDHASQLVDRVLDSQRLTGDDMRELRRELAAVDDPGTTTDVYRRLIVALNTRKLLLDDPGLLTGP